TAKLRDYILIGATDYTFVTSDRGERMLMVEDTMVETLTANVTDFHQPEIYGHTGDPRGPVYSAGGVVFSGLVITPTDMGPQDPLALYQGDGLLVSAPSPVALVRLSMRTMPTGAPTTYLKSIQVKSSGTLFATDIAEAGLYLDNTAGGETGGFIGLFDGEQTLGGVAKDIFISTGSYSSGSWHFDDLNVKLATATLITNMPRNYFLTVRVSTTATTPTNFAFAMDNQSFVTVTSTYVGVAYNNFPIVTATSPVVNQKAKLYVQGADIGAWWQPVVGGNPLELGRYDYISQGAEGVGMLKLQVWTDGFISELNSFTIIKKGSGPGTHLAGMRLFLDAVEGDYTQGNGVFEKDIDKKVTDKDNPPVCDPVETDKFILPIADTGSYGRVDGSTRTYFVVFDLKSDALDGLTHGARLEKEGMGVKGADVQFFSPVVSVEVPVRKTEDIAYLSAVNKAETPDPDVTFSRPSFLTQNDADRAVARLTMQIDGLKGSAVWKGLKLDRWVTHYENSGSSCTNKVSDITKISIWHDSTGDGLLQTSGALKDTEVLLDSGRNRVFPAGTLANGLSVSSDVIRVTNIQQFFSSDSPFPRAPGRLILNDGQSDPALKEVVYYTAVNDLGNAFEGVSRGMENTAAVAYSSGIVISGQAVLPLIGTGSVLDGQVLFPAPKDYFITFSVGPLATVDDGANLGLSIRGTDYFLLESSKTMSTINIGPGESASLVGKTREYADAVVIKGTDTLIGDTLQQKKTNQAILSMTAEAAVSDTKWRWLLVYATGAVVDDGTARNDVDIVRLWHDADRNGFLDTAGDVLVGTGAFGTPSSYGLLTAKVMLFTPATLFTESEAQARGVSQRYFITYDIKEDARPNDDGGNPRYLGAYIKAESFPMGSPTTDDTSKNAFSLPNYYSTASTLPFVSLMRAVVSAASTVTVVTGPIFSGGGSQNVPAPELAQDITSPGDQDTVLVTSTAGLPSAGYALVDNEIVHYSSLHDTVPALQDVTRGKFGSPAVTHSSGAVIGTESYQGSVNLPFMKFTLATPGTGLRWESVKFTRRAPSGLTGYDDDVTDIIIRKDNGNGVFDRDPVTGVNLADPVMGQGKFGSGFDPLTKATILVADPALDDQDYVVISATPTVFFVSMSIDKASRFSNEALSPANDVLGLEVQAESHFTFGPPGAGHSAYFPAPVRSQTQVVMPELNTIILTPEDISPAFVTQNDKNVGVLSMQLVTDKTSAKIEALTLNKRGTCNDSDITVVKVWQDSNDNCVLDSVDISSDASGSFPNLMSYGNESYYNGMVSIALKKYISVTTTPSCAFISYDISQFAVIGSSAGLNVAAAASFAVGVPNQLIMSSWPVNTFPMAIGEIDSDVTLGVYDAALDLISSAGSVRQAQKMAPMLRFNLAADSGNALWSAIRVQRTPTGGGNMGSNDDVKFIQIYRDFNQNDELDVNDLNISEAEAILQTAFASTDTLPFNLVLDSTAGFPSAGNLYIGESELVSYSGSGIAGSGKPYLTITSRGDVLGGANTPLVYHKAGVKLRKVDIYNQVSLQDSQRWITLARTQ
ncbi:MAG: hypothetical protein COT18_10310, partial [Elusimicrobia bacterium CG08_land_8_20_14_0_20_59_10]